MTFACRHIWNLSELVIIHPILCKSSPLVMTIITYSFFFHTPIALCCEVSLLFYWSREAELWNVHHLFLGTAVILSKTDGSLCNRLKNASFLLWLKLSRPDWWAVEIVINQGESELNEAHNASGKQCSLRCFYIRVVFQKSAAQHFPAGFWLRSPPSVEKSSDYMLNKIRPVRT